MESLKFVIIEDEEAHFSLMQRAIAKDLPHAVVYHFQDTAGCLESLDEILPSVIIADYLMPGMNGIELLEALNQRHLDIPVIIITGQGDESVAVRAMKLGAKDYLVKTGSFFNLLPSVIEKVVYEKKISDSLQKTEDVVRNLSQILLQAQERERLMISYELHDRIAQNLSRLKIDCDTLFDGQAAAMPGFKEKMDQFSKLIQLTIDAVRDLAYDLRPPGIDQMGLAYALQNYCLEFSEKNRLKVDLQIAGIDNLTLDYDTKIHVYRLLQEGLVNIHKHAGAELATVRVVGTSPNIILRIEDNGRGFDVRARELALDNEKRLGLRSMQERTNLLGGRMTIQSEPGKGTKIFIKFPFKEQPGGSKKAHHHH